MDLFARLLRSDLNDAKKTDYQCVAINEIAQAVYDASRRPLLVEQTTLGLSERLDHLVADQNDAMGARLAAAAAKKAYSQILADGDMPSLDYVKKQVHKQFDRQLLENRFLSPVRQGVVKGTHRSLSEQQDWEHQVTKKVVENKRLTRRLTSSTSLEKTLHTPLIAREG